MGRSFLQVDYQEVIQGFILPQKAHMPVKVTSMYGNDLILDRYRTPPTALLEYNSNDFKIGLKEQYVVFSCNENGNCRVFCILVCNPYTRRALVF